MPGRVWTQLALLLDDLRAYGEDDVADQVQRFDASQMDRLRLIAYEHSLETDGHRSGAGMMVAKALALAAVEVAEGAPRPLRRARRIT